MRQGLTIDDLHYVERRVDVCLELVRGHPPQSEFPLVDFADEVTYHFVVGRNPEWTFAHCRFIQLEIQRRLEEMGFNVRVVYLEKEEYCEWLRRNKLKNTQRSQANF